MGGLSAALRLAAKGLHVTVLERAAQPGGKMRQLSPAGLAMDAGPTVFTMRHVFETLFDEAGASLDDHVGLAPLTILARHAWADGGRLDLHASVEASAEAVGDFAGAAKRAVSWPSRRKRARSTPCSTAASCARPSLAWPAWPATCGRMACATRLTSCGCGPLKRCGRPCRAASMIHACASSSAAMPPIAVPRRSSPRPR
ncbi:MAG: FAD-dependent oxidoreductase [Hyphomicrobiales bacterium]|nr:FAD-dependent oxidoreductase [Hyphomicrobiales bacterium]